MYHFLKKIIGFILLLFVVSVLALIASSYIVKNKVQLRGRAAIIDKTNRIASLPSPKIVLIGGSNVSYGINSKMIEDSLKMPVVNMSINARIGQYFYMEQIKPFLKKGDIVVTIPEYGTFSFINYHGDMNMYALSLIDQHNLKHISLKQSLRFPLFMGDLLKDNYATMMTDSTKNKVEFLKERLLYNEFGDYEGHKNKPCLMEDILNNPTVNNYNIITNQNINPELVQGLNNFAVFCKEREVNFYISFPVYAKPYFNKYYASKIKESLNTLHWLNAPEKYLYNFDQLYNTPDHLLYEFRNNRTEKLVEDLKTVVRSR